jgi:hypothetical protein
VPAVRKPRRREPLIEDLLRSVLDVSQEPEPTAAVTVPGCHRRNMLIRRPTTNRLLRLSTCCRQIGIFSPVDRCLDDVSEFVNEDRRQPTSIEFDGKCLVRAGVPIGVPP